MSGVPAMKIIYSIYLLNLDIQIQKINKNQHKRSSFRYNVKVQWLRIIYEHSQMNEHRRSNTPGHVGAFVLSEVSGDTELPNLENTPVQTSNMKVGMCQIQFYLCRKTCYTGAKTGDLLFHSLFIGLTLDYIRLNCNENKPLNV